MPIMTLSYTIPVALYRPGMSARTALRSRFPMPAGRLHDVETLSREDRNFLNFTPVFACESGVAV